ncbi:MAG: Na+/H+ antiporter NhaC family protein [Bacteroidota bacterium]
MKISTRLIIAGLCLSIVTSFAQSPTDSLTSPAPSPLPRIELSDYALKLEATDGVEQLVFTAPGRDGQARIQVNDEAEARTLIFRGGQARLPYSTDEKGQLLVLQNDLAGQSQLRLFHTSQNGSQYRIRAIPLWLSIVPPLLAILLALIFREVIVSLFTGIWAGAFIANGMRPGAVLRSFWEVIDKYLIQALNDSGHLSVIVFSLLIGGMVALISRNGGMAGVVQSLSRYARSPRSSQFITWLLGVAIFFDDYANTLIVGNTMRSVTDRFRISREKLAYLVDSTAAPVSAIAFITTWIGAELGYIQLGIEGLEGFDQNISPYALFISSLKYSFYPILTLGFMLLLIYSRRDFGPMYQAEFRARSTGQVSSASTGADQDQHVEDLSPVAGAPLKWYNAVIPVLVVILVTIYGLIDSGMHSLYGELAAAGVPMASESWSLVWANMAQINAEAGQSFFVKLGSLIGASDSYIALLWASLSGVVTALALTVGARIMRLAAAMDTMTTGFKTMLPALIILALAWSLAITTEELHTANFLTQVLQGSLSPYAMPVLIFVLSALIAFSTGSSWSTMAILYPIAIPTTWALCQSGGLGADISMELLLNVIAVVLAASVLGDHCSPISDTTILSSLASDCNHIDHVRTQMPYALVVGSVALMAGGVSTLLGGGWLISIVLIIISLLLFYGIIWRFGKRVD